LGIFGGFRGISRDFSRDFSKNDKLISIVRLMNEWLVAIKSVVEIKGIKRSFTLRPKAKWLARSADAH
jgi:hypothetical protein